MNIVSILIIALAILIILIILIIGVKKKSNIYPIPNTGSNRLGQGAFYVITNVIVQELEIEQNSPAPPGYTGLRWNSVTTPYIPELIGTQMGADTTTSGIGGGNYGIFVEYGTANITDDTNVLTDLMISHWGHWDISCPDGYTPVPNGKLTPGTRGPCWDNGVCAKYTPISQASSFVSALAWSWAPNGPPISFSATVNNKTIPIQAPPNSIDVHTGCGDSHALYLCLGFNSTDIPNTDCSSCVTLIANNNDILDKLADGPVYATCNPGYCNNPSLTQAEVGLCQSLCEISPDMYTFWATSYALANDPTLPSWNTICSAYGYGSCIDISNCSTDVGSPCQNFNSPGACTFECLVPSLQSNAPVQIQQQSRYDPNVVNIYLTEEGNQCYSQYYTQFGELQRNLINVLNTISCSSTPNSFNFLTQTIQNIQTRILATTPQPNPCTCCTFAESQAFIFGLCTTLDSSFIPQACQVDLSALQTPLQNLWALFQKLKNNRDPWLEILQILWQSFVSTVLPALAGAFKGCQVVNLAQKFAEIINSMLNFPYVFSTFKTNYFKFSHLITLAGILYTNCCMRDFGSVLGMIFSCLISGNTSQLYACSLEYNPIPNIVSEIPIGTSIPMLHYMRNGNYQALMDFDGYFKVIDNSNNVLWQSGISGADMLTFNQKGALTFMDSLSGTVLQQLSSFVGATYLCLSNTGILTIYLDFDKTIVAWSSSNPSVNNPSATGTGPTSWGGNPPGSPDIVFRSPNGSGLGFSWTYSCDDNDNICTSFGPLNYTSGNACTMAQFTSTGDLVLCTSKLSSQYPCILNNSSPTFYITNIGELIIYNGDNIVYRSNNPKCST